MLVMPTVHEPGHFILRIQGDDGEGAIVLDPEAAMEVADILAPTEGGAWLEARLRAAFQAGRERGRYDAGYVDPAELGDPATEDQFVAAELAKVVQS